MQDFIRRKNIENLTKQLASGRLDEAQRRYAQQKLTEELAAQRDAARERTHPGEDGRDFVPSTAGKGGGHAASC